MAFLPLIPFAVQGVIAGSVIVGATITGLALKISSLKKQLKEARKKSKTKQEYIKIKQSVEIEYIQIIKTYNFQTVIADKMGKQHICFLGPTSVGKSSLCNVLFNCQQEVGLGETTQKAVQVFQTPNKVYWDARGINDQWDQYREEELGFFKNLDKVFVLYCGSISDIRFLAQMLSAMNLQLIFVRTKCDQWKEGMKSLDEVLKEDEGRLQGFQVKFTKVIGVGRGMLNQIKQLI